MERRLESQRATAVRDQSRGTSKFLIMLQSFSFLLGGRAIEQTEILAFAHCTVDFSQAVLHMVGINCVYRLPAKHS